MVQDKLFVRAIFSRKYQANIFRQTAYGLKLTHTKKKIMFTLLEYGQATFISM